MIKKKKINEELNRMYPINKIHIIADILKLFDELDPYESQELKERLLERGYNLTIDKYPEDTKKLREKQVCKLYLKGFDPEKKVRSIKTIWNLYEKYNNLIDYVIPFGTLREAKDFIDNDKDWKNRPLLVGSPDQISNIAASIITENNFIYFNREYFRV